MSRKKGKKPHKRMKHIAKLAAATAAVAPIALVPAVIAQAAVLPVQGAPEVKASLESVIAEELNGETLEVGESVTIDLDDVFDNYDEAKPFVQNGSVANVTISGDLMHIGATKAGTTMVDVMAWNETGEVRRTTHERFKLTVAPNAQLDIGTNGMAVDDLIRYINQHPDKFTRREDYRTLLDVLSYGNKTGNDAPAATYAEPVTVELLAGESETLYMSDFFSDADGDELTYTVIAPSASTVGSVLRGEEDELTISAYRAGSMTITLRAADGVTGHPSAQQVIEVVVADEIPPAPPVLTPSTTGPTNGNVTVSIGYSDDSQVREYRIGAEGAWGSYDGPVVLTGNNTVYAKARDASGNWSEEASLTVNNIDRTAPIVDGVEDMKSYKGPLTITFSDESGNLSATLNGSPFTSGGTLDVEGNYELIVRDAAGNKRTIHFAIDKTAPVVTGVVEGGLYRDVTITFSETPAATATLDGVSFESGSTVTAEGPHTLIVTDAAGNSRTVNFSVDKTAPTVTGVSANGLYNSSVTIAFSDPNEATAKLNGVTYVSGTAVTAEGQYTLVVTDTAGNERTVAFKIDTSAPLIGVPVLQPSTVTNQNVTVTPSIEDSISGVAVKKYAAGQPGLSEFAAEGFGTPFTNSFTVQNNGTYTIYAADLAGNATLTKVIVSNIDRTAPVISSVTANPSTWTNQPVVVTVTATDDQNTVAKMKYLAGTHTKEDFAVNGEPFTGSFQVSANGTYTVYVEDQAGNGAVDTVTIENIDMTPPTIAPLTASPLEEGWVGNVTITVNASDANGIAVKKWLPGDKQPNDFALNGTDIIGDSFEVSANGSYTVYVKDTTGNESVRKITISNINEAPEALYETVLVTLRENQLVTIDLNQYFTDADIHDLITVTRDDGAPSFSLASGMLMFNHGRLTATGFLSELYEEDFYEVTFVAKDGVAGHESEELTVRIELDDSAPVKNHLSVEPTDRVDLTEELAGYVTPPVIDSIAAESSEISVMFSDQEIDWISFEDGDLITTAEDVDEQILADDATVQFKYGNAITIYSPLTVIAHTPVTLTAEAATPGKTWYGTIGYEGEYRLYDVLISFADIFTDPDFAVHHFAFTGSIPEDVMIGYEMDYHYITDSSVRIYVNSDESHTLSLVAYDEYNNVLETYALKIAGNYAPDINVSNSVFSIEAGSDTATTIDFSQFVEDEPDSLLKYWLIPEEGFLGTLNVTPDQHEDSPPSDTGSYSITGVESGRADFLLVVEDEQGAFDEELLTFYVWDDQVNLDPGDSFNPVLTSYTTADGNFGTPSMAGNSGSFVSPGISGDTLLLQAKPTGSEGPVFITIPVLDNNEMIVDEIVIRADYSRDNTAPVLSADGVDGALIEGSTVTVDLNAFFTDADDDILYYDLGENPSFNASVSGNLLTLEADESEYGTVLIMARDEFGAEADSILFLNFNVFLKESSFEVVEGSLTFSEASLFFPETMNGEPLTLTSAESNNPEFVDATVNGGILTLTGTGVGMADIIVTAYNGHGIEVSRHLSVNNLGDVPYFKAKTVTLSLIDRGDYIFTSEPMTIDLDDYFTDLLGGELTYTVQTISDAIEISDYVPNQPLESSEITVRAVGKGESYFEVTATNGRNKSVTRNVSIDHWNVLSEIEELPEGRYLTFLSEGEYYLFDLFYYYPFLLNDPDENDRVTVEVVEGGEHAQTILEPEGGGFSHLSVSSPGDVKLKVTLDDGIVPVSAIYSVHILEENEFVMMGFPSGEPGQMIVDLGELPYLVNTEIPPVVVPDVDLEDPEATGVKLTTLYAEGKLYGYLSGNVYEPNHLVPGSGKYEVILNKDSMDSDYPEVKVTVYILPPNLA